MADRWQLLAASRAASELVRRREADPLVALELFGQQPAFCRSTKPIAVYTGANRIGKSTALARIGAAALRTGNLDPKPAPCGPGMWIFDRAMSVWIVGQTDELMRETIIPLMLDNGLVPPTQAHPPLIPPTEIAAWHPSIGAGLVKLKNGSIGTFKSGSAPSSSFYGAARDVILFDEPPRQDVWNECAIRISGGGHRLSIRVAATLLPEGGGSAASWFFLDLVLPWQAGQRPDVDVFTASIFDNPHLRRDEIQDLERRYPPGTPEHDIRILGKLVPGVAGTLAYPAFSRPLHAVETLGPHTLRSTWPLCLAIDFNVHPMVCEIGQVAGNGDDRDFEVLDEIFLAPGTIPQMVEEFRRRYPAHGAELRLYPDASGQARNVQTGVSDHAVLLECFSGYPAPVRLCVPTANPDKLERLNAVNRQLRDHMGRVRLRVAAGPCRELIRDLEGVLRDPTTVIKKSSKPNDPYRLRTHASDALGYWIAYEAPLPAHAAMGMRRRRLARVPSPQYTGFGAQTGAMPRFTRPGARAPWGRPG